MLILAIETSCDETAIAIVEADLGGSKRRLTRIRFNILSNIVSSQVKIHKKWGGVVPSLAKREHQRNLVPVLEKSLRGANLLNKIQIPQSKFQIKSKIQNSKFKKLKAILIREDYLYKKLREFLINYQKPKIDLIAVTVGPGLEPALWLGVNFAKALSFFWDLPIISVSHIEGHIFANFLDREFDLKDRSLFPLLSLSVAGGHTQLILMKDYGKYKLLGETRDDTAGECFDKVARMLNLGYPGGPIIAQLAQKGNPQAFNFPRPMIYTKDYDFSFSGLKTSILYFLKKKKKEFIKKYKKDICASFQQAIIDVLIKKTIKAAHNYKVKTILLSGGVAANEELRRQLQSTINNQQVTMKLLVPPKIFCTDNGAMIGAVGYFRWKIGKRKSWQEIKANANLKI